MGSRCDLEVVLWLAGQEAAKGNEVCHPGREVRVGYPKVLQRVAGT